MIFKSLIRTYFLNTALDSFYSRFKESIYDIPRLKRGDRIYWRALSPGMRLSRITQYVGASVWEHYDCSITGVNPMLVEFTCTRYDYAYDDTENFRPRVFEKDGPFRGVNVLSENSDFYI